MNWKFIEKSISYTGRQLRSHWIYKNFNLLGDAIVAFTGRAKVEKDDLVDLEDEKAGFFIESSEMLHFIVEHFGMDLELGIHRQRLLATIICSEINHQLRKNVVERRGDNIYDGKYKISVSIATLSPVSVIIHEGINVVSTGTPVKTRGLLDYGIDPRPFSEHVMRRYCKEIEEIRIARCKVRGVK
ncbi:MAG: DUF366 family protein [bacterium]|nr:DUF366 family protein [bacterium]